MRFAHRLSAIGYSRSALFAKRHLSFVIHPPPAYHSPGETRSPTKRGFALPPNAHMKKLISTAASVSLLALAQLGTPAHATETASAQCFKPLSYEPKTLHFKAKKRPYRRDSADGFLGN